MVYVAGRVKTLNFNGQVRDSRNNTLRRVRDSFHEFPRRHFGFNGYRFGEVRVQTMNERVRRTHASHFGDLDRAACLITNRIVTSRRISQARFEHRGLLRVNRRYEPVRQTVRRAQNAGPIVTRHSRRDKDIPITVEHNALTTFASYNTPVGTNRLNIRAHLVRGGRVVSQPGTLLLAPSLPYDLRVEPILLNNTRHFFCDSAMAFRNSTAGQ